jgi:hypothetical protein
MTPEEFEAEINSRPYSKMMRLAFQEAGKTPMEFIRGFIMDEGDQVVQTDRFVPNDAITQDQLISEIERLGHICYKHLTNPKHIELINTIGPQWRHREMTPGVRRFALTVLGALENIKKNAIDV